MPYSDADIGREIEAKLDELEAGGRSLHANWITHAICSDHRAGLVDSDEAEFWRWGGYRATRNEVRRRISKRHATSESQSPRQGSFFAENGFLYVQDYYMVVRNGEDVGVPTLQMTEDEIEAKARMLEAMGRVCQAHADELRQVKGWRSKAA